MGQSIFSNVVIATVSRVVVLVLGFCATALTVRIISAGTFGTYSLLLTIGTFIQLFADFGLYLTASRELGVAGRKQGLIMRHIVSLRLTLLLGFFTLGIISFLFIPSVQSYALIFTLLALGLVFQSMSQLMMGVFQAYGDIWKATVGDVIGRIVQVGILGYLFYYHVENPLTGIVAAFSVSLCIASLVHFILAPRAVGFFPKISIPAWRYLVKTSWPIGAMLVLNVIYFRSDIPILAFFRSAEEIGWYSLAYKIIDNGLFFPAMLGGLLLPHLSSAWGLKNTQRAQSLITQGLALSLYIGIILVVSLLVFAFPIVMFFNPEYGNSVPLLRVLSVALAIMFAGNIFGFTLIALTQQRKLMVLYGVLVVVNIALNILFVPIYGAHAAAWVTVGTELLSMGVAAYLVYREITFKVPLVHIILATLGALVATYVGSILPDSVHIGFRLAVTGALYAGIGYCLGLWNKETLSILRTSSSI